MRQQQKICMKPKKQLKSKLKTTKKQKKTKKIKNDFSFSFLLVAWALSMPSAAVVVAVGVAATALFRFYLVRCLLPSGGPALYECVCVCMNVPVCVCELRKSKKRQFNSVLSPCDVYNFSISVCLCVCFILCFIQFFVSFPLLISVCFASSTFRLDQHIDTAHARRCRCGQEGRRCWLCQQQHSQIHIQRRRWRRQRRSQQPEQY